MTENSKLESWQCHDTSFQDDSIDGTYNSDGEYGKAMIIWFGTDYIGKD